VPCSKPTSALGQGGACGGLVFTIPFSPAKPQILLPLWMMTASAVPVELRTTSGARTL